MTVSPKIHLGAALKHPRIVRVVALVWLLLVIVGSLQPARPSPIRPFYVHELIHWGAFAGASFLLLLLSATRRQEIAAVIATCLLGLAIEYLQHIMYRNAIEWRDVTDDCLAILVSFAVYRFATISPAPSET